MQRRIDLPAALVVLGGLLLVISLFVSWFADSNAWEAFEALDLVLLGIAGAAALTALGRLGPRDHARPALVLAVATLVIVVVQLLEPPPGFGDDETEAGVWIALLAGVLMTIGAALGLASINVTVDVSGRKHHARSGPADHGEAPTTVSTPPVDDRTQPMPPDPGPER